MHVIHTLRNFYYDIIFNALLCFKNTIFVAHEWLSKSSYNI